ncbi:MAG: hypothetical protein JWM66_1685, partial [Solirubrobacterales bacterium]|nr:hypothetical protein [Solirubrobacterales bacterium]
AALADDLEAGALEQAGEAFTEKNFVIRQRHPCGAHPDADYNQRLPLPAVSAPAGLIGSLSKIRRPRTGASSTDGSPAPGAPVRTRAATAREQSLIDRQGLRPRHPQFR